MNKPLNQYESDKEKYCELEDVLHYRLSKMIGPNIDIIYQNNQMHINQITYDTGNIQSCKWKYITYLQNNGIQNTKFEKYILDLNIDNNKLIDFHLKNGGYLTTYVM